MKKLLIIFLLLWSTSAFGATYWIRQGGTAANEGAATGPCNTASACGDDSDINSWASVGDTVNICSDGGDLTTTITGSGACNNGACDSDDLITYQKAADSAGTPAWNGNTKIATITGDAENYKEYLKFKDLQHIEYNTAGRPVELSYVKNVTIDNVDIDIDPTYEAGSWGWVSMEYVEDIVVQNSYFDSIGTTSDYEINGFGVWYQAKGILLYNNYFGTCSHDSIQFYNETATGAIEEIVIRSNVFENRWEHTLSVSYKDLTEADNGRILIEQNIFKYGGYDDDDSPCTAGGGGCEANQKNYPHVGTHQVISRDNIFYNNDLDIGFSLGASGTNTINDWKHYHNTHYNSAIPDTNTEGGYALMIYTDDDTLTGFAMINNIAWLFDATENGRDVQLFGDADTFTNDRVENNIFGETGPASNHYWDTQDEETTATCNTNLASWSNNEDGDPLFTNAGSADFTLVSGSPAIDKGTYLTEVNDSGGGSGTSMVVDDATFFYGADWSVPGGGEVGDYIHVDNPSSADFTVQITGANYATDTLTLASSQMWDDNADVYWCPLRNAVCFYGETPDAGAYEYTPGAIRGVSIQ